MQGVDEVEEGFDFGQVFYSHAFGIAMVVTAAVAVDFPFRTHPDAFPDEPSVYPSAD